MAVVIRIDANDKKAFASVNGAEEVQCSLVKESSGKYSVNIKKLGFGKSFINIGELADKEVSVDEGTLVAGKNGGKKKGPHTIVAEGAKFLSEKDAAKYEELVAKINEGYQKEFDENKAEPKTAKTDLEKLEAQLQRLYAKREKLLSAEVEAQVEDAGEEDTSSDDLIGA